MSHYIKLFNAGVINERELRQHRDLMNMASDTTTFNYCLKRGTVGSRVLTAVNTTKY